MSNYFVKVKNKTLISYVQLLRRIVFSDWRWLVYLMECICCEWRSSSLMYDLGVRGPLGVKPPLGVEGFVEFLGVEGADAFFFCRAWSSSTFATFTGREVSSLQTSRCVVAGTFVLIFDRPLGTSDAVGLLRLANSNSPSCFSFPLEAILLCHSQHFEPAHVTHKNSGSMKHAKC